jgi:RNA polymerase sigma factor (TIGR02999 family)
MRHSPDLTDLLVAWSTGDETARSRLIDAVYNELRGLARGYLRHERADHSLAPTALVHEAYLKLVDQSLASWHDRLHFLALASVAMRHVLVDRARARVAKKRGGGARRVPLHGNEIAVEDQAEALLQLEDALTRLAKTEPRLARVVECRFFGGLTEEEVATALGLTTRTVQRDWVRARQLLRTALENP